MDLSLAASDAQHIIRESSIAQKLVGGQIVCRRLLQLLDRGIADHLEQEYELAHPRLVLEQLQAAALERAVSTPCSVVELRDQVMTVIFPLVDIFCKIEEDHAKANQETVSGNDPGPSDELGTVLHSPDGAE
jgi:hypothetical protein